MYHTNSNTALEETARSNTQAMRAFGILSCIVIPLYTLLFASRGGLLTSNLSKTGNLPGNQFRFILWGVVCAASFHVFVQFLYAQAKRQSRLARLFMQAACVLLTMTVLFPFRPTRYPICAMLHDTAAKSACALTVLSTLLLSIDMRRIDAAACRKAIFLWAAHFLLCLFLLLATGTSGLTESMFIITTAYQLFGIMRWTDASISPSHVASPAEPEGLLSTQ